MKLHKIILGFFLILFLIGFIPSVFAPADDQKPANGSEHLRPLHDVVAAAAGATPGLSTTPNGTDDQAAGAAAGKAKGGAKEWLKKKLFGDPAVVLAYNQKLRSEFTTHRQQCNAVIGKGETSFCVGPHPMCVNSQLQQACGKEIPAAKFAALEGQATQKIADLSKALAGKLNLKASEIMGDIRNQTDTTCGNAWGLAQVTCQFPVQALGGKVTSALNVIGKVAMGTQMVAGLAGKSLNDLCKALTTLSGAGVTIAILARVKCASAISRCQKYCNSEKWSQPGYCNTLYSAAQSRCESNHTIDWAAQCSGTGGIGVAYNSCIGDHTRMAQYACKVKHINKMKQECGLLKRKTMAMMGDIVQLIRTVQSAKMCWDKSGGDMSPPIDPETCRKMGGTSYIDETTGDQRCRFRDPNVDEGKCPPFGVPVSCDLPCEDGSVPEGCPQGVCENGEVVSCTKTCPPNGSVPAGCDTCPDPSLTYPYCDCNCSTGQTCNDNRQCVDPENRICTTSDDCGGGQVCNPEGQCVPDNTCNPECGDGQVCKDEVCVNASCNTNDDCGDGQVCKDEVCVNASCNTNDDCGDGQVCKDEVCVNASCNTNDDCGDGQVCKDEVCVNASCNTNDDCGVDKICQNGECFCNCQGSPISCSEKCGGKCVEESVNCPCQGNGECTPPQTCVPGADGQKVCSDDDGEGICPNGSRVTCDKNCPDGSKPANCRVCNSDSDCGENQTCPSGVCIPKSSKHCKCQDADWPCDQKCDGKCVEESVKCLCQGDGECTSPQKCVPGADGQKVCSDDDGLGICSDGSRVTCDKNCPDGSKPANCRTCGGDSDCGENQICNRGVCTTEDPVLTADGLGGGGTPTDGGLGEEDEMAIINDGMGGGGADDPNSNIANNKANLPGASLKKPGLFARLGALLGVKGGGGLRGSRGLSGRGSKGVDKLAKDDDETGKVKGTGRGGYGGYGSGGGGALNPAAGGLGFGATATQIKKQKGNQRTAFPTHLGNIGGVHQNIFKAVTKRYQKLYKLKNTLNR